MYLGNIPATSFEAVKKDRFTGLTGTGVTLSHSVSNVQDVVVWVNRSNRITITTQLAVLL